MEAYNLEWLAADQLYAVAEGIVNVAASYAGILVVAENLDSRIAQACDQSMVVPATERGMGFWGRTKILFHAQMDLHVAAGKPASATLRQLCWLLQLGHAQQIAVEGARGILLVRGHRELNVINSGKS